MKSFLDTKNILGISTTLEGNPVVIRGRMWTQEDRMGGWALETLSFEEYERACARMGSQIEYFAFDELNLDEDAMTYIKDDLTRYAADEGINLDVVEKTLSALNAHKSETISVVSYAVLKSGRVLFIRAQSSLGKLIFNPEKLLSPEGMTSIRKLKNLLDH